MLFNKVIIYRFPASQNCMDCVNGEFVQSETFDSSDYMCRVNCEKNDGVNCPKRKLKEDDHSE